jgi:hypothetical protein
VGDRGRMWEKVLLSKENELKYCEVYPKHITSTNFFTQKLKI